MRAVGCFLEYEGKFVILLRHSHKPDGDTWGLAGGKVEKGEQDTEAVLRELAEETGYAASLSELEHLGNYNFISSTGQPYVYGTYRVRLKDLHNVKLESASTPNTNGLLLKNATPEPTSLKAFTNYCV